MVVEVPHVRYKVLLLMEDIQIIMICISFLMVVTDERRQCVTKQASIKHVLTVYCVSENLNDG